MLLLEAFALGFFVKVITGIDDVLTRVPVIASLARTRKAKIAFSAGAVCAVMTVTTIAFFFSELIHNVPSYRTIVAVLIVLLAIAIKFDVFVHKPHNKTSKKLKALPKSTFQNLTKQFLVGYVAAFTTVLDDAIAYLPVFFGTPSQITFGVGGILCATILQAIVVIFFAERIACIPYKEEIAASGLFILAALIFTGVL